MKNELWGTWSRQMARKRLPLSTSRPFEYESTVAYHRSHNTLGLARLAIGVWCWLHGVAALLLLNATSIESTAASRFVAIISALSTVPVGAAWIRGPWPEKVYSLAFVGYAEIGVAAVLLSVDTPLLALPAAALLTVVGSYAVVFHGALTFVVHSACTMVVCGVLYVRAVTDERTDVHVATAYMVILLLVLFGTPALIQILLTLLHKDADGASVDPLTGLRNRRGLDSAVEQLLRSRAVRHATAGEDIILTAAVIDIDKFKSVNDVHGHAVGDTVLTAIAERLRNAFPAPAITSRVGGEEFVVLALGPEHALTGAGDTLGAAIRSSTGNIVSVTASAGVADMRVDSRSTAADVARVIERADYAMYAAKRAGGDRVADVRDQPETHP